MVVLMSAVQGTRVLNRLRYRRIEKIQEHSAMERSFQDVSSGDHLEWPEADFAISSNVCHD